MGLDNTDKISRQLNEYYRTFTGVDSLAFFLFPDAQPVLIGSVTTISYSIYREKVPVKVMSRITPMNFTKGYRFCAGTMICTMINKHLVNEIIKQIPWLGYYGKVKIDELPPFDIMIISANEYGASASMQLYAVEFIDESQTLSIEDLFTENQFSFVCKDIDVLNSDGSNNIQLKNSSTSFIQPINSITTIDMDILSIDETLAQQQKEAVERSEIDIFLNGRRINFPDEKPKLNNQGMCEVPLRFVFEAMGWGIDWLKNSGPNVVLDRSQFRWGPKTGPNGNEKYLLDIYNKGDSDVKQGTCKFYIGKDDALGWEKVVDIPMPIEPYVTSKNRIMAVIRPLLEGISKYIKEDEQKWSVTWGGSDGKSVFLNSAFSDNRPIINEDSNNIWQYKEHIENVQALLNENNVNPKLKVNGVFDYTTKWALTSYQLQTGLTPSGYCDKNTWSQLVNKSKTLPTGSYPIQGKVIAAGGAYIRKMPIEEDKYKLATKKPGDIIDIYGPGTNGWYPVKIKVVDVNNIMGWVKVSQIKI